MPGLREFKLDECKPGEIYRLSYKLAGQRFIRYAQLEFLGAELIFQSSQWSGRPTIGTLSFTRGEIYTIHERRPETPKTTYFDKRCHPG